ncbi:MAG: RNA 2'-phosphotransferase [Planctomycetota bacterium]|nr:RNA 2'-phosphotransferase [Planctomycetota bacterium]
MNSGSLNERITRALAFMLRHQPDEFDLELDRFGWGDLEDVIYALQERIGSHVEDEDVEAAIAGSDRKRYEIKDDKIRALYGHSFPIDPGEPTEPPDELFIGVGSRDAARAEEKGLRSGRRAFLHLARTEEEAREAGRRAAREYAVITVFAGEAFDEGIDFYDRGSLFLADEVPVEFLEVGETFDDGFEREQGRRSRGRRNNDRPRGGGRRRGRRDDDEDRGRGRGGRDRDRDDTPRPPRSEEPEQQPERDAPAAPGPGFGLGLDGGSVPEPEAAAAPAPEPEPEPEVIEERAPEPEVPAAEETPSAPGFGFGAGLE